MAAVDKSIYEKITLSSVNGAKTADIRTGVVSLNYYEDVFSPMITARMVVINTGNTIKGDDGKVQSLYNGFPLRGGEKVEILSLIHISEPTRLLSIGGGGVGV